MNKPKFRMWDGKKITDQPAYEISRKMLKVLLREKKPVFLNINTIFAMFEKDGLVTLQSTGLQDINNIEVFQGDILENAAARWEVVFEEGLFAAKCILKAVVSDDLEPIGWGAAKQSNKHIALRALKGAKKIGTKYENPELLKP